MFEKNQLLKDPLLQIYEIMRIFDVIEINFSKNTPVFSFKLPFFGFMQKLQETILYLCLINSPQIAV